MASPIHNVLVELLEAHPEALTSLLELQGNAPAGPLVAMSGTRAKTFTLERRVDRAFVVGSRERPLDAILGMVDEALRMRLESRIMERHEYRSELFRGIYKQGEAEGEARGEAKGKAQGKAEGILTVLAARGITVSDATRERILGCTEVETLDAWLQRAAVASTAAAVVRAKTSPRAARPPARRATAGARSRTTSGARSRARKA